MKVKDLIEQLGKEDPETEVIGWLEDSDLLPDEAETQAFDIQEVITSKAEVSRDKSGGISVRHSMDGRKIVFLELTAQM